MIKYILLFALVIVMSGCATGYHPYGLTGGYTDTKIQEGIYNVGFDGNANVSALTAENFALLRSAEVALENGYKYFVIIGEDSARSVNGVHINYKQPSANNFIQCFKEKPTNVQMIVYDAQEIKDNLRKQYGL